MRLTRVMEYSSNRSYRTLTVSFLVEISLIFPCVTLIFSGSGYHFFCAASLKVSSPNWPEAHEMLIDFWGFSLFPTFQEKKKTRTSEYKQRMSLGLPRLFSKSDKGTRFPLFVARTSNLVYKFSKIGVLGQFLDVLGKLHINILFENFSLDAKLYIPKT